MDNNLLQTIMAPFIHSSSAGFLFYPRSKNANKKSNKLKNANGGRPIKSESLPASPLPSANAFRSDFTFDTSYDKCIDNVHFKDLFQGNMSDSSSVAMPHSIRNDPRLYNDDVDIRFSRTLNSCKLPQIRYASPQRLFERLTDLRFLSIDFLNTFLLTYRVFTDGVTVLEALKKVHYNPDSNSILNNAFGSPSGAACGESSGGSLDELKPEANEIQLDFDCMRRVSATSTDPSISNQSDIVYGTHRCSVISGSSVDMAAALGLNQAQFQKQLQQFQQQCAQCYSQKNNANTNMANMFICPHLSMVPHHQPQPQLTIEQQLLLSRNDQHWRLSYRKFEEEQARERCMRKISERLGQTDSGGESEPGQSMSGATNARKAHALNRRRTSNSAPSSRTTSVDVVDTADTDTGAHVNIQIRSNTRVASICVSAASTDASGNENALPGNQSETTGQILNNENQINNINTSHLVLPLNANNGPETNKMSMSINTALSPMMDAPPMPPPPSPVGAMYEMDQCQSRNRIQSNSSADENDSSYELASHSVSDISSGDMSGSEPEVDSEPEMIGDQSTLKTQSINIDQYGNWKHLEKISEHVNANEQEPFSMAKSQLHNQSIIHSISEDTLKAENQSECLSPSISSGASSSTLVGDNRSIVTPKRSPVSKNAPMSISPLARNEMNQTTVANQSNDDMTKSKATSGLLKSTSGTVSAVNTPKKAPVVPPRTKTSQSQVIDNNSGTAPLTGNKPEVIFRATSAINRLEPFASGGSVIRRHSTADTNSNAIVTKITDRACSSARNSIVPDPNNSTVTSSSVSNVNNALKRLGVNQSITQAKTTSQPAINQAANNQHRLSCISNTSSNYLRVLGGTKRGSNDSQTESATARNSFQTDASPLNSSRSSFAHTDAAQLACSKAGVVVTSSRASTRRSSTASAASAFAVATAASSNPVEPISGLPPLLSSGLMGSSSNIVIGSRASSRLPSIVSTDLKYTYGVSGTVNVAANGMQSTANPAIANSCISIGNLASNLNANSTSRLNTKRESVISTAATMRVLNVLRHWISKHSQDFENDLKLLQMTTEFLNELVHDPNLLPAEHKAATQLLKMITREDINNNESEEVSPTGSIFASMNQQRKVDLEKLLTPPEQPCNMTILDLNALEVAETMTYIDHKIFISVMSCEFLGQSWMRDDKLEVAPNILRMTRRFNEMSKLVASEIIVAGEISRRVIIIEKWTAVADICRCLHNFNGVLQIISAFTNSSIYRLKRTWERVSKTSIQIIEKLQKLVSADGRFRNMREALHRCDPPCIPYLGMYLTDLSFIEEGTPNFTNEGLLNFSKMRMIAHVIREIRTLQQTPYKIEKCPKVVNYLLDTRNHIEDETLYQRSLYLEPRLSRIGTMISTLTSGNFIPPNTQPGFSNSDFK